MIVILTGAKKNVGDYLIGDRAIRLLKTYLDDDIVQIDRFLPLDDHLDTVNNARALILCGGPAYAKNIYPGIYPLTEQIDKIKVPIIPFGLGWSGKPFEQPEEFAFDEKARLFLERVHEEIENSSCRDVLTEKILKQNGFQNVTMTGCPVWYDLDHIHKAYEAPSKIKRIVFSTGASSSLVQQTWELIKLTRRKFPEAHIHVTFHRGILPGRSTPPRKGVAYTLIALLSKLKGLSVHDVSGNLDKIDFYKDCDLHIGYRVHAHLLFLSQRKPSLLINEDGRGLGMTLSFGLPVLNFNQSDVIDRTEQQLNHCITDSFGTFKEVMTKIDSSFATMRNFLEDLNKRY